MRPVEKVVYRHVKQTGGSGQFAHVVISLEPTGPGGGYEFIDKITGGKNPKEFIPAVDQGIQSSLDAGVLAGYPVVDVRAVLTDGSAHDVDSSEMAFKIAGSMAFKEAARKAQPVLLEPIMAVEVVTPEDYMGDVFGDLNARRGRVGSSSEADSMVVGRRCCPRDARPGLQLHRPAFHGPGPGDVRCSSIVSAGSEDDRRRDRRPVRGRCELPSAPHPEPALQAALPKTQDRLAKTSTTRRPRKPGATMAKEKVDPDQAPRQRGR